MREGAGLSEWKAIEREAARRRATLVGFGAEAGGNGWDGKKGLSD